MKTKIKFVSPRVTQMTELFPEWDILGRSIEDAAKITSMGQEVRNYDFSGDPNTASGYSVYWEEE